MIKTPANVKYGLERLPLKLNESYHAIFKHISNPHDPNSEIAVSTMKWLLCSKSPLKTKEFIAAVTIHFEEQDTPLGQDQLLDICCNMFVLDSEYGVFRFAHLSVRAYLEGIDDYKEIRTHIYSLETCIDTCLSLYATPPVMPRSEVMVKRNDLFKQYAVEYWLLHWQNIKTDQITRRTGEKLRIFLFESGEVAPSFTNWASAAGKLSRFGSHPWDGRKA
jgi:hypothetical protein